MRNTIPDDVLNADVRCSGRARPWLIDALAGVKSRLDTGDMGMESGR